MLIEGYLIGALATWFICWIRCYPISYAMVREHGKNINNIELIRRGTIRTSNVIITLLTSIAVWWYILPAVIIARENFCKGYAKGLMYDYCK